MRHRSAYVVLVVTCTAQLIVVQDFSIVTIVLPEVRAALGFSATGLQWVMSAYSLGFAGFLLVAGRASDAYGRRRFFCLGCIVIAVGTTLVAAAPSASVLVGGRALQGIGSACVAPAALAIVAVTFPEGPRRVRALSIFGAVTAAGLLWGMVLGGVLAGTLGWRWTVASAVPVVLLSALAGRYRLPADAAAPSTPLDLAGATLACVSVLALVAAASRSASSGWTDTRAASESGLALIAAILFVLRESRARSPLVPTWLLRRSPTAVSALGALCAVGTGVGVTFITSLYLREILDRSPLDTGVMFSAIGIAAAAAGTFGSRIVAQLTPLVALVVGLLGQAVATGGIAGALAADLPIACWLALAAFGFGHVVAGISCTVIVTTGLPSDRQGTAGGLLTSAQQVGGAIGLGLMLTAAAGSRARPGEPGSGYLTALWLAALSCAVGALIIATTRPLFSRAEAHRCTKPNGDDT